MFAGDGGDDTEHDIDEGIASSVKSNMEKAMSTPEENDDVVEANLAISRPEESKAGKKEQAERILSVAMPPAGAGAAVTGQKDEGETKDALKRRLDQER